MNALTMKLERSSRSPLYLQIYQNIVGEIRRGNLAEGEKLPSKRELSAHLGVSLNTIETAYEMLSVEGYVEPKPKSGFYVRRVDRLPETGEAPSGAVWQKREPERTYRYSLATNRVDTSAFPYATWAKLVKEIVYHNEELLNHGDRRGDEPLRAAIAKYLHEYRGVRCTPDQVVVGAGMEYLLGLVCGLFGERPVFAFENPCYDKFCRVIENSGGICRFADVDREGMSPRSLAQTGASVAYLTPSHQFPLGVTMPIGRRMELLAWANSALQRYLIEDDYDSEFRYGSRPIPAMQGLDHSGRVLYISTFSRSLAPSMRIAYMVLPPELLRRYEQRYRPYSATVSRFEQHTLCRFMEDGHLGRHLGRMRNRYRVRLERILAQLEQAPFRGVCSVSGESAGLHFLLRVKNGMTERELIDSAAQQGVLVRGLGEYYLDSGATNREPTLVIGYAGLADGDVPQAFACLARAWFTREKST
ncbi:PLP-dependent aminotransferase family protein [Feifania hominis]|uniref:PLP-dependent aminotransferase family protein n=1 Tax=Feifania hominis TaxID=2763660 RepID=A0A926DD81_9FIRM|nr:PLP-dependent aminotransferase family protein [Feifania hominis]MBC8535692.1 PLP-dependent aminotransferase family protein [Feifania hominis]